MVTMSTDMVNELKEACAHSHGRLVLPAYEEQKFTELAEQEGVHYGIKNAQQSDGSWKNQLTLSSGEVFEIFTDQPLKIGNAH